jgi:cardiolipin synthase
MRWVRALSRLLYNYLLRDGVRIHEYASAAARQGGAGG